MAPGNTPPGNPSFNRRVRHANQVHFYFIGSRDIRTRRTTIPEQTRELQRAGLGKRKKGENYLVMTKWGAYNKMYREGFGKPWERLTDLQKGRIIATFVLAHMEEAYFPSPRPEYVKKVPYNAQTRFGLISFFDYFVGLHQSLGRRARANSKSKSPEVRETAAREVLLNANLVLASRAVIEAINNGSVKW